MLTHSRREEIRAAAREDAIASARAQGLPDTVTDPEAVAMIVALFRQPANVGEPERQGAN